MPTCNLTCMHVVFIYTEKSYVGKNIEQFVKNNNCIHFRFSKQNMPESSLVNCTSEAFRHAPGRKLFQNAQNSIRMILFMTGQPFSEFQFIFGKRSHDRLSC